MSAMTQAVLFVIAVFGVTWTVPFLWPAPPNASLRAFLVHFVPLVWAPTLIALIFVALLNGAPGVRDEIRARLSYRRGTGRWLLIAVGLPAVAMGIAILAARATGGGAPFISAAAIPTMVGVQVITGAVGEELGWRGFLLPRLGERLGITGAGWIMAGLWSLWHVPAFFDPTMPHYFMPKAATLASIAFFGVFLAFVFNRAGGSVLASMLAHLSLNVMAGFGGVQFSSVVFWSVLAVIFAACALLTTIPQYRGTAMQHGTSRGE